MLEQFEDPNNTPDEENDETNEEENTQQTQTERSYLKASAEGFYDEQSGETYEPGENALDP
jgi:hypothetical protein